jgi:acetoin utilization deacetylase AcuC-like enzyme
MKIVFHKDFHKTYTSDPAAAEGRLKPAEKKLRRSFEFVNAQPAKLVDIERVHTKSHVRDVQRAARVYPLALLAAGGTLQAARLALTGQPAFALVRPPGHHASPSSCWGFCYFNNIAVAVATLLDEGLIASALILDIDLHFGDGTDNTFDTRKDVEYLHPEGSNNKDWLAECRRELDAAKPADLIAVSAGFDRHIEDWGTTLETESYRKIGGWVKDWAEQHCNKRMFAVLEGGYNHETLADAAQALAEGMQGSK